MPCATGSAHKYLHIFASLQIATNTPKAFNTAAPGRAAHQGLASHPTGYHEVVIFLPEFVQNDILATCVTASR